MIHPARKIDFDTLWNGLQTARGIKHVNENIKDGLHLYCYTDACVYEKGWNDFTMLARGIILNPAEKKIVATPFIKFFNVGEREDSIPDLPFETFEKLDGSLIILFFHNDEWRTATKGSLNSEQAKWAAEWIKGYDLSALDKGTTYLAEAIYPENRIVVHYAEAGLVLLGAYDEDGNDIPFKYLERVAETLGWKAAKYHSYNSVSELMAVAKDLPATEEGFVIRFVDGLRLKVKGDEYCRIHRLVSRVTPLAMWEAMLVDDDLDIIRKQLPEEFWADFDQIIKIINLKIFDIVRNVRIVAGNLSDKTDKEVGLMLSELPEEVRPFIFSYRKHGNLLKHEKTRQSLFRVIRPTGNRLDGYVPSSAMNRVAEAA